MKTKKKMQSGGTSGGYPKDTTTSKSPQIYGNTTSGEKFKPGMQKGGTMKPPVKVVKKKKPSPETQKKIDRTIWQQGQGWGQNQTMSLKTGGMVNPNAKMQAQKVAGSKGVKSGVNPKAAASKVAKGRSGGTSVAPKTALPKAQKGGWTVDDPYKRGVMGSGATATKTSPRTTGGLSVIKGGTKTKTISAGPTAPGAKGSINVTKTNNEGRETISKTKYISQKRANRMINRKRG